MSKASDPSKVEQVRTLLRELIAERELAQQIAAEQGDDDGVKEHRHASNRYYSALDHVGRA